MPASRFAPSPTGLLHLGHAWSALVAHDVVRAVGGTYLWRIDDLDSGRVRQTYRDALDRDLGWLGLLPDAPPLAQSERLSAYAGALERLRNEGLAYRCFCTRAEIAASVSAPHGPDNAHYPGTCRAMDKDQAMSRGAAGEQHAWRLDMAAAISAVRSNQPGAPVWQDHDAGCVVADPASFGDVVLVRRDGAFAYHLASSVDDAAMSISHVVRGLDLFAATHVHRLLQALLDLPTPYYIHHRLVAGADGRRLAKRHDSASIASLRAGGANAGLLIDNLRQGVLPLGYRWLDA